VRVLTITHTYPYYSGDSTAPFIDLIARGLAGRGHSIDVVLPYHPEFRHVPNKQLRFFPYRYSPIDGWSPWGFGNSLHGDARIRAGVIALSPVIALSLRRRIRRLLTEFRYDLVHAHWAVPNAWLAAAASRRNRVPLVISLWGSDVSLAEHHAGLRAAVRRAFETAAAVTACGDDLRERAQALGAPPLRTRTIRHGVDSTAFSPERADTSLRNRLSAGRPDDLLLVAVGRLVEVKGFEYLIAAASRLEGVRVALIGEGDLRPKLEELARTLGAPVTFLGNLYHEQVAAAMATADAIVIPSVVDRAGRVDGLPSTVLEALASGRPVIATRVGGIPEVVTEGETGLLVPEKDPAAMARAIEHLRGDPAARRRLGAEARRTALTNLSWDHTLTGLETCFREVTGQSE